MERKIGDTFEHKGKKLIVEESNSGSCSGCFFNGQCPLIVRKTAGECQAESRVDNKYVIFMEVKDKTKEQSQQTEPQPNLNLGEILKDCPKGWKFWSPIFGEVEFVHNYGEKGFVNISVWDGSEWSFASDATIFFGNIKSREVMLYPTKELRDWSKFTAPWYKHEEKKDTKKFDPKTLEVFDKVLARVYNGFWFADFVSVPGDDELCDIPNLVGSSNFNEVVPYNEETKHLLGTADEAPEYYQYVDEDDEWDDED